jgi:purine catabolism regulator
VAGFVAVRPESSAPVLAIYPLPTESPGRAGRRLARSLVEALEKQFPQAPLVGGLSRPLRKLSEIKEALNEAEQAWSLGRRLATAGGSHVTDAADLGVYRLLLPLEGSPVLPTFYRETIGVLEDYDRRHSTDLMHTLDVYFTQLGNLSRTAEVMHLHRNTLIYRLERIAAILGADLDDAEVRLRLQLALKARQILRT